MIWRLFTPMRGFFLFLLSHLFQLRVEGRPSEIEGPLLLAPNHLSLIDWAFLICVIPRKIRFVMRHDYFRPGIGSWLARNCCIIPICTPKVSPEVLRAALSEIGEALTGGEIVCIFAEGQLTRDGKLGRLQPGIVRLARKHHVSVVPIRLEGLHDTFWGLGPSRRPFVPVSLIIGERIKPEEVSTRHLADRLEAMAK